MTRTAREIDPIPSTISRACCEKRYKRNYAANIQRYKQEDMIDEKSSEQWRLQRRYPRVSGRLFHHKIAVIFGFLLQLIATSVVIEAASLRGGEDKSHYEKVHNGQSMQNLVSIDEEGPSLLSAALTGHTSGDQEDHVDVYFRRTQTAIPTLQVFRVKLAFRMLYVDVATSDALSNGRQKDPVVHRLCSAVNMQVS